MKTQRLLFILFSFLILSCIFSYRTQTYSFEKEKIAILTPKFHECEKVQEQEGRFWTITAYCSCSKCCGQYAKNRPVDKDGIEIIKGASGRRLVAKYSVASDLPFGTKIDISGFGVVEVMDRGGAVHGNHLDLFFSNHAQALQWGKRTMYGYIMEE